MFPFKLKIKPDKPSMVFAFTGASRVIGAYQNDEGDHVFTDTYDLLQEDEKSRLTEFLVAHHLLGRDCGLIMPPASYHAFLIDKPDVSVDKVREAIRWKMAEYIDFPLDNASVDYIELPSRGNQKDIKKLYVIVAHQDMIQEKKSLIESCGLKVHFIDIPESALKYLSLTCPESEKGLCLIKINKASLEIILIRKGMMLLMRKVECDLEDLFSETPLLQDKLIQEMALEIQRSIDYCSTNFLDVTSSKIKIISSVNLPCEKLNQILGVEVSYFPMTQFMGEDALFDESIEGRLHALGGLMRVQNEAAN